VCVVLLRQTDRSADADGALRRYRGGPCSDTDGLLGLPGSQRRQDAVQMDVRLGEQPGRIQSERRAGQRAGGRCEVRQTGSAGKVSVDAFIAASIAKFNCAWIFSSGGST